MDENDEVPYEAQDFFRPRAQTWPCKVFDSYDGENTNLISTADVNNITINTSNDSAIGCDLKSVINTNGNSAPVSTSPSSASSANSTSNAINAQLTAKKSNSRRNAWGSASYADLITQAINNSPDKRLTLSQIYEWMVQNVPYFKDKGDSNSSAGWKVRFCSFLCLSVCISCTWLFLSLTWLLDYQKLPNVKQEKWSYHSGRVGTADLAPFERTRGREARRRVRKRREREKAREREKKKKASKRGPEEEREPVPLLALNSTQSHYCCCKKRAKGTTWTWARLSFPLFFSLPLSFFLSSTDLSL